TCTSRILDVDPKPNVAAPGRVGAHLLSRSSPQGLLPFIAHLPFVARSAELSNDNAAECRQSLLTLLVRQPTPKLLEHERDRRVRGGGKRVVALGKRPPPVFPTHKGLPAGRILVEGGGHPPREKT